MSTRQRNTSISRSAFPLFSLRSCFLLLGFLLEFLCPSELATSLTYLPLRFLLCAGSLFFQSFFSIVCHVRLHTPCNYQLPVTVSFNFLDGPQNLLPLISVKVPASRARLFDGAEALCHSQTFCQDILAAQLLASATEAPVTCINETS